MTIARSKRVVVIGGLLICAVLLHVSLCRWDLGDFPRARIDSIFMKWVDIGGGNQGAYGLAAREGVALEAALRDGLVLPLALVFTSVFMMLHWRERDRVARGCCVACGYPLGASGVCAECGGGRTT